jgi:hypothetical protein
LKNVLGDYTMADLFELPTQTIEKYKQLSELLSTFSTEGAMSAESLQTFLEKYPNLM